MAHSDDDIAHVEPTDDELGTAIDIIRRIISTKMDLGPKVRVNPDALGLAAYLIEDGMRWRYLGLHEMNKSAATKPSLADRIIALDSAGDRP